MEIEIRDVEDDKGDVPTYEDIDKFLGRKF